MFSKSGGTPSADAVRESRLYIRALRLPVNSSILAHMKFLRSPLLCFFGLATAALAGDWPPVLDTTNTTTQATDGRKIERYVHGPRTEWGYPASASREWGVPPDKETGANQQNHAAFYVVAPKQPREGTPLCVVLHSANRTAYDYLGYACLGRQLGGHEDTSTVMTNSPDDFYSLYLNSTNAEWWGWKQVNQNVGKQNTAAPAELRVLDTIEWVASRYKVDRNRIYLCGVSMGGCGTLGIGIVHGELFAAIRATVPAGTEYAAYRTGGFVPAVDPPVITDFSSPKDNWSKTQPALVEAVQAQHLPLMLCWGPFGHTTFSVPVALNPTGQVALAFPWLEIRKNEAYPVFTHASCDQRSPWLGAPAEFDEAGQSNAYFRWKAQQDTPSSFAMQLWLAHPEVKMPLTMPETATADVTPRRFQQFKVQPGKSYMWSLARDGKVTASGKVQPDAAGLLTIPQLTLTTTPAELSIKPE